MPINFFSEEIDFIISKPNSIKKWLRATSEFEEKKIATVNYIFCNDAYLLLINNQYLKHDDFTDIITFDNSEVQGIIEGDIYISIERVKYNATLFKVEFREELNRVIIHGLLHLLGFKDKEKSDKENMTAKENFYLSKLKTVPRGTIY